SLACADLGAEQLELAFYAETGDQVPQDLAVARLQVNPEKVNHRQEFDGGCYIEQELTNLSSVTVREHRFTVKNRYQVEIERNKKYQPKPQKRLAQFITRATLESREVNFQNKRTLTDFKFTDIENVT
ncbi:MAG: hypothetical protein AB1Z31_20150, partial [Desulfobacterales bacterium]